MFVFAVKRVKGKTFTEYEKRRIQAFFPNTGMNSQCIEEKIEMFKYLKLRNNSGKKNTGRRLTTLF